MSQIESALRILKVISEIDIPSVLGGVSTVFLFIQTIARVVPTKQHDKIDSVIAKILNWIFLYSKTVQDKLNDKSAVVINDSDSDLVKEIKQAQIATDKIDAVISSAEDVSDGKVQ